MALSHDKPVKQTTTTERRDTPLKHPVQVAEAKIGKKLSELLRGAEATLLPAADRIEVQQVGCDSRKVKNGALFFALHGA